MSHPSLIDTDYDAAEVERRQRDAEVRQEARLELATRYEIAVHAGDQLTVRCIEALVADIDARTPHGPRLLAQIRRNHPAAA
ncbi:hypothetical protein [Streptomyces sp. NBC_00829]|uniref:hypothetical protein n=1 Tax=Streptomyces sp. NBC_00829 TaxID=2903679 RepID=UPI0038645C7C|nr:hypothetical protein OG293_18170 [Streptomyces sp. NBC_00829]